MEPRLEHDHISLTCGACQKAMAEIAQLRAALEKVAVIHHYRMAQGGETVPSGYSCEICEVECGGKLSELRHRSDCPLFPLNSIPT